MAYLRVVEVARDIDPYAAVLLLEVIGQVAIGHEVKPREFHNQISSGEAVLRLFAVSIRLAIRGRRRFAPPPRRGARGTLAVAAVSVRRPVAVLRMHPVSPRRGRRSFGRRELKFEGLFGQSRRLKPGHIAKDRLVAGEQESAVERGPDNG